MDGFDSGRLPDAALAARFALTASEHDQDSSFPHENFRELAAAGLLGLTVPAAAGGGGAGLGRSVALIGAVGAACSSTALVLAMQLVHSRAATHNERWPARLRSVVAQDAVQGGLINALRVEPALGTPTRGGMPETTARRTAAGWSISGHKIYCTGVPGLRWMLVYARTDEDVPRVGFFLVPAQSQGVSVVQTWDQLGLRASGSHDVVLRDVVVPADHAVDIRLPGEWRPDPAQAAWNTVTIAALYTGVATAARDWLVQFLRNRVPANLGAPLASLPRMQEAVGGIEALLMTNRRLIADAAAEHDRTGGPAVTDCNLIKTVTAENAIRAVEEAVKLTGNHGLSRANPLERHLRDVLCARIHTPQADAALVAAGRAALGQ
jgi:alkylation response protein AidB-like acyl-CoA dehydrogenase